MPSIRARDGDRLHPYIMGAPHRLKYFRRVSSTSAAHSDVLFWTGEQILDWFLTEDRRQMADDR